MGYTSRIDERISPSVEFIRMIPLTRVSPKGGRPGDNAGRLATAYRGACPRFMIGRTVSHTPRSETRMVAMNLPRWFQARMRIALTLIVPVDGPRVGLRRGRARPW